LEEIRKIVKVGKTSFGIVLPKKFLKILGFNHHDILKVSIQGDKIILEKYNLKE
jgi:antitoxin component of MazEF toxin-antitoxin module